MGSVRKIFAKVGFSQRVVKGWGFMDGVAGRLVEIFVCVLKGCV